MHSNYWTTLIRWFLAKFEKSVVMMVTWNNCNRHWYALHCA
jgi:hypothetical protein